MKKCFFTGLVTLLPLAVTIWVVSFVVRFLTKPFMGIMTSLLSMLPPYGIFATEQGIRTLSQILILIGLFLIILTMGIVARRFFFHSLIKWGDLLLARIPIVNKVYKTSKEIIQALFTSKEGSFKQVVLVPFPHKECYCIGLITSNSPRTCSDAAGMEMASVFIPTTPNPTTGYLIMCPKEEIVYLKMKSEEAVKYIVSVGVIQPERPGPQL